MFPTLLWRGIERRGRISLMSLAYIPLVSITLDTHEGGKFYLQYETSRQNVYKRLLLHREHIEVRYHRANGLQY